MEYEAVIGLEVHAQLLTESKMFCGCRARDYASAPPNTRVCPICLGMPGTLPVPNRRAVEFTVMTGLALNCTIAEFSRFDRKNYFYPDLPKGYQISQYDLPLCQHGYLEIEVEGQRRRIGIRRVHLEEDTGKLSHHLGPDGRAYTLVDLNRAGVPLIEIVTEPDLRSATEAAVFLRTLRAVLQYLGVSSGSMEEGSFRCDANVSVRPVGAETFGTKVEVKNMNSFRAVERALQYEIERQIRVLASGGQVEQETRGWDETRGVTVGQRTKEFAHDYRYFPEPDIPPLVLSRAWIEEIRTRLPELPAARRERFMTQYGLSAYDASLLTSSKAVADFFEETVQLYPVPKTVANWITGELFRLLNATGRELEQTPLRPALLADLLRLVDQGTISLTAAKTVFEEMFQTGRPPATIVAEKGLAQISAEAELRPIIERVLAENPQGVRDYLAGKKQALGFLVGQVMKATRGRANPAVVNRLLAERLAEIASAQS